MTERTDRASARGEPDPESDAELPGVEDLRVALATVLAADHVSAVSIIERSNAFFSGTFPNEVIRCRVDKGPELSLFCKYSHGYGANSYGHRGSVEYEAIVYEHVLQPLDFKGIARFYGAYREPGGAIWLVTECVTDFLPLTWLYDPRPFQAAAKWIGGFHSSCERVVPEASAKLTKYNAEYFLGWVERTLSFGGHWQRRFPWLTYLCRRFEDVLPLLLDDSTTVIHGEFYGKNVLQRQEQIFAVDWESAAVGTGEIDLAAITEGWPDEWRPGTEEAYKSGRWPEGAPAEFSRRLDAARMYLHLRWLGDRPEWTCHPNSKWRFQQIHHHGERLGLL
ncbi:MAG: phosphotransferase [Actinomycetota bacterium]